MPPPSIGANALATGSVIGLEGIVECPVRTIARKAPTHVAAPFIGDRRFILAIRPIIAIRPAVIAVGRAVIRVIVWTVVGLCQCATNDRTESQATQGQAPEKLEEAMVSGSLLQASEVAEVVIFMLTRRRGMTIRDVIVMPTNFDL